MKTLLLILMMVAGPSYFLFAQEGPGSEHTQENAKDTADQKCRSKCHRQHCEEFGRCYRIDDEKGRAECQDQVNKDENHCMQTCDLS